MEEERATWQCSQNQGLEGTQLRPGGLVGREGPPGEDAGSELGLQSQAVVGPLIQEWGGWGRANRREQHVCGSGPSCCKGKECSLRSSGV